MRGKNFTYLTVAAIITLAVALAACGGSDGSSGGGGSSSSSSSTSSAARSSAVVDLTATGSLLAADGAKIVYTTGSGTVHLRDTGNNHEVILANVATLQNIGSWVVKDGRVFLSGEGPDCSGSCIYMWQADGSIHNISGAGPAHSTGKLDRGPAVEGDYVLWATRGAGYTLYKISTGTYQALPMPTGHSPDQFGSGGGGLAVAVSGSVITVYYAESKSMATMSLSMFRWVSDTGITSEIATEAFRPVNPVIDGQRVAWVGTGFTGTNNGLYVMPINGDTSTRISGGHASSTAKLADGVLAWSTNGGSPPGLDVYALFADGTQATLVTTVNPLVYGTAGGIVVYRGEFGQLFGWNPATGMNTLLLADRVGTVTVTTGAAYFTKLEGTMLYRVALN